MPRRRRPATCPRSAIVMNLEHAIKRPQEVFAGVYRYARHRRWQIVPMPFSTQIYSAGREALRFDGIIARADGKSAAFAASNRIPIVNVWYRS